MKTIYDISKEYLTLLDRLEENGGEFTPEIETALQITKSDIEKKGVAYLAIIKTFDSQSNEIENEIKRLQALKKQSDNIVLQLKERLKNALIICEIDEIKTATHRINFRTSKSVNIYDVDQLPSNCVVIKKEPISKVELRKRLEDGEFIPGAELVENLNLQIK